MRLLRSAALLLLPVLAAAQSSFPVPCPKTPLPPVIASAPEWTAAWAAAAGPARPAPPVDFSHELVRFGAASGLCVFTRAPRLTAAPAPETPALSALEGLTAGPSSFDGAKDGWKFRLYAGHSFTRYAPTDIKLRSSRYNVDIEDYEWQERGSREYFRMETWGGKGNNPLMMLDEPSNTFTLSAEKGGHELSLSAFHAKFLQAPGQVKPMKGTIDGTPVDGVFPIDKPFDGYDQVPGELELVRNQNTYREMILEVGYGRRLRLAETKRGSLTYVPGARAGVVLGNNLTVVVKPGSWWDYDDYRDPFGLQGLGGSLVNRLEFNSRSERVGLFYENKLGAYRMKHGFMDGTQTYALKLMSNSVGVKFLLFDRSRR